MGTFVLKSRSLRSDLEGHERIVWKLVSAAVRSSDFHRPAVAASATQMRDEQLFSLIRGSRKSAEYIRSPPVFASRGFLFQYRRVASTAAPRGVGGGIASIDAAARGLSHRAERTSARNTSSGGTKPMPTESR